MIGTDASGDTVAGILTIETEQLTFRDGAAGETEQSTSGDRSAEDLTIAIGNLTAQDGANMPIIASSCAAVGENKFIITGRGGLPPSPNEVLSTDAVWVDWGTLNPKVENSSSPPVSTNPTATEPAPIVEARGWVINGKGEVMLTATAPCRYPSQPLDIFSYLPYTPSFLLNWTVRLVAESSSERNLALVSHLRSSGAYCCLPHFLRCVCCALCRMLWL